MAGGLVATASVNILFGASTAYPLLLAFWGLNGLLQARRCWPAHHTEDAPPWHGTHTAAWQCPAASGLIDSHSGHACACRMQLSVSCGTLLSSKPRGNHTCRAWGRRRARAS